MKISEMIEQLEALKKQAGDVEVATYYGGSYECCEPVRYVARLMYEAMDHCERRYRAYDPKDPWIMVDNDNKLHSYASKKPNQLNNFGPCWVVICWLVDHPEVAEQFGIKMGFV